jgi:hypothetical protein
VRAGVADALDGVLMFLPSRDMKHEQRQGNEHEHEQAEVTATYQPPLVKA